MAVRESPDAFVSAAPSKEASLWAAVLTQCLEDAFETKSSKCSYHDRIRARRWLTAAYGPFHKDRIEVLHLLGLDVGVFDAYVAKRFAETAGAWREYEARALKRINATSESRRRAGLAVGALQKSKAKKAKTSTSAVSMAAKQLSGVSASRFSGEAEATPAE